MFGDLIDSISNFHHKKLRKQCIIHEKGYALRNFLQVIMNGKSSATARSHGEFSCPGGDSRGVSVAVAIVVLSSSVSVLRYHALLLAYHPMKNRFQYLSVFNSICSILQLLLFTCYTLYLL